MTTLWKKKLTGIFKGIGGGKGAFSLVLDKERRKSLCAPIPSAMNKKVFGVPIDPNCTVVPSIVSESLAWLKVHGMKEEGLFRVSGNTSEVQSLKQAYDNGEPINLDRFSVHAITSCLKSFFRELPEPLFTFERYLAFVEADAVTPEQPRLDTLKKLVQSLPKGYYVTLRPLFSFLCKLKPYAEENKMTSTNLAIVFAPNLLRAKTETYQQVAAHSPAINSVIKTMIEEYKYIFEEKIGKTKPQSSLGKETTDEPEGESVFLLSRRRQLSMSAHLGNPENPDQLMSLLEATNALLVDVEDSLNNLRIDDPSNETLLHDTVNIFKSFILEEETENTQDESEDGEARTESEVEQTQKDQSVAPFDEVQGYLFQMRQVLKDAKNMKQILSINRVAVAMQKHVLGSR